MGNVTANSTGAAKCRERVTPKGSSWHTYPCDHDAVEDGLCRLHLAARRRRSENADKRQATQDARMVVLLARAEADRMHAEAYAAMAAALVGVLTYLECNTGTHFAAPSIRDAIVLHERAEQARKDVARG